MVAVAYGSGRLREVLLQILSQFERGFTKVLVTGTGRLREWSSGELRLYSQTVKRFEYVKSGQGIRRVPKGRAARWDLGACSPRKI